MKKIITMLLLIQLPVDVMATNYFNVSAGSLNRDSELSGVFSTTFFSETYESDDSDSGFLLGLGISKLTQTLYHSGNLYIPSSDNDDDFILDISSHYRLNKNVYAGAVIGWQKLKDSDAVASSNIGANSSTIDLSGVTAGFSFGYLSSNERFDLNFKLRFINGDKDSLSGNYLNVDYSVEMEVTQVLQFTLGYNF